MKLFCWYLFLLEVLLLSQKGHAHHNFFGKEIPRHNTINLGRIYGGLFRKNTRGRGSYSFGWGGSDNRKKISNSSNFNSNIFSSRSGRKNQTVTQDGDSRSWTRGALDVNMLKKWLGLPDSWIPPQGFNIQVFSIPLGNDGKPDVQALIKFLRLPTTYTLPLGFDINGKGLDFNVNVNGTSAQGGQRFKTYTGGQVGSGGDSRSWSSGVLDVNMLKKWLGLPDSWIPPQGFNIPVFSIPLGNDGKPDVQALIKILRLPTTYTLPLGFDINGKGLDFNVNVNGTSAQGGQRFKTYTGGQVGSGGDSRSWSSGVLDVNMLKKWLGLPDSWIPPQGFNIQVFSIPLGNDGKPDVQALIKILRLPTTYTLPLGFDINGKGLHFNVNVNGTSAQGGQRFKTYTGGQVGSGGDSRSWSSGVLDVNMLKKWLGLPDSWIPPQGFNIQVFSIPLGNDGKPDVQALIKILRLPTTYTLPLGFDINGKGLDFNVNVNGTSAQGGQRFKTYTGGQVGSGGDSRSWSSGVLDVNMLKKWLGLPDSWIPPQGFNIQVFSIPLGNDGKPDVQALIKILRLPTTYTLPLGFDINGKGLDFNVNVNGTSAQGGQRFKTYTGGQVGFGGDSRSWSSGVLDVNMLKKWLGLPDSWIPPQGFNIQVFSIPLGNDGKPDVQALIKILRLPTTYTLPLGFDINGKGLHFNVNVSGTSPQGGQRFKTYTGGQEGSGGDSRSLSRGALDVNMLKKWLGLPNSWIPPRGFNFQTFSIPLGNDGKPDVQALINILRLPTTYTLPRGFDINNIDVNYVISSLNPVKGVQGFMSYLGGQGDSGSYSKSLSRGVLNADTLKKWLGLPDNWTPPPGFNFQTFRIPLGRDENPDVQALINILRLPSSYTLPRGFDINNIDVNYVISSLNPVKGVQGFMSYLGGQGDSGSDSKSLSRGVLNADTLKKWLGLPDNWTPPPGFNFQTFRIPLGRDGNPDVQALIYILRLPSSYTLPRGFDINNIDVNYVISSLNPVKGVQRFMSYLGEQGDSGSNSKSLSRGVLNANTLKKWLGLPDNWTPPPGFNFQTFRIPLGRDGNPDVQALINILRLPSSYTLPRGFDINNIDVNYVISSLNPVKGVQRFMSYLGEQGDSGSDSKSLSRGVLNANTLKKWLGLPDNWTPPPGFNFQTFRIPLDRDGNPDVQALINILGLPSSYTLPRGFDINNIDVNYVISSLNPVKGVQGFMSYLGGQGDSGSNSKSLSRGVLNANTLKKWLGLPDNWTPPTGFNFQTFRIPLGKDGNPDVQALINILGLPSSYTLPRGFDINNIDVNYVISSLNTVKGVQGFMSYLGGQGDSGSNSKSLSRGVLNANTLKKWLGLPDNWTPPTGFNFQTFRIPLGKDGNPDVQALINILRLPSSYTLPRGFDINNIDVNYVISSLNPVKGVQGFMSYLGGQGDSGSNSKSLSRGVLNANTLKKWLGLPDNWTPPTGFNFQTFRIPLGKDGNPDVQALINILKLPSSYTLPRGFDINNIDVNYVISSLNPVKGVQGFMSYLGGQGDSGSDSKSLLRGVLNADTLKKWLGLPDNWTPPTGFNFQTFRIPLGKDGNPDVQALINILRLPSSYTLPRGFDINNIDVNYVISRLNPVKGVQGFLSYLGGQGDSGSDSKSLSRGVLNADTLKKWLGLPDNWTPPTGFNFQTFRIPLGKDGNPDVQALINILRLPSSYTLPRGFDINNIDVNYVISSLNPVKGVQGFMSYLGGQGDSGSNSKSLSRGVLNANTLKKWLGLPDNWTPPTGFNFQTFRIPLGKDGNPDVQALINILGLPSSYTLPRGFDINNIDVNYVISSLNPVKGVQGFMSYLGGQGDSGSNSKSLSRGVLNANTLKKWLGLPDNWTPPTGFNFQTFRIPLGKDGNPDVQTLINILGLSSSYKLPRGFDMNNKDVNYNVISNVNSAQGDHGFMIYSGGQGDLEHDSESLLRGAFDAINRKKRLGLPDNLKPPPGFNFQAFGIPPGNDGNPEVQTLNNILGKPSTYTLHPEVDINKEGKIYNVTPSGTPVQSEERMMNSESNPRFSPRGSGDFFSHGGPLYYTYFK